MSVRCITRVLDSSQHAGTSLLMLVVLADYSDDEGRSYPAVASLARKCRMTPRNANYILADLQSSGELKIDKQGGPHGTNRYRILLDALGPLPGLKPTSPLKPASPLKPTSSPPEAGFPKPLKPTSAEPSLNRQEPSSRGGEGRFAEFWSTWPSSKRKQDRKRCLAKWKAKRWDRIADRILAHVEASKSSRQWTEGFEPAPLTYLNGERWEDGEPAAAADPFAGAI